MANASIKVTVEMLKIVIDIFRVNFPSFCLPSNLFQVRTEHVPADSTDFNALPFVVI